MVEVFVHSHALKHGLAEDDIIHAWANFVRTQHRAAPNENRIVSVGYDREGRFVQMMGAEKSFGVLIYHAMTPPTKRVLKELGMIER